MESFFFITDSLYAIFTLCELPRTQNLRKERTPCTIVRLNCFVVYFYSLASPHSSHRVVLSIVCVFFTSCHSFPLCGFYTMTMHVVSHCVSFSQGTILHTMWGPSASLCIDYEIQLQNLKYWVAWADLRFLQMSKKCQLIMIFFEHCVLCIFIKTDKRKNCFK